MSMKTNDMELETHDIIENKWVITKAILRKRGWSQTIG
jgi:hypothetical protein